MTHVNVALGIARRIVDAADNEDQYIEADADDVDWLCRALLEQDAELVKLRNQPWPNAYGKLRIYAELADPRPEPLPGNLVLVNLPANCSVEGTMCEFRLMLEDAVHIARQRYLDRTTGSERLDEIEAWLRGEGP